MRIEEDYEFKHIYHHSWSNLPLLHKEKTGSGSDHSEAHDRNREYCTPSHADFCRMSYYCCINLLAESLVRDAHNCIYQHNLTHKNPEWSGQVFLDPLSQKKPAVMHIDGESNALAYANIQVQEESSSNL
jgi:hypothetical protein